MIFVDIIQIHLKRQLNYVTQLTSGTPEILIPLCCSTTPVRYFEFRNIHTLSGSYNSYICFVIKCTNEIAISVTGTRSCIGIIKIIVFSMNKLVFNFV